ncbi:MAG: hypothetical protein ACLQUY_21280 [Ktedonobacterales bacterium]
MSHPDSLLSLSIAELSTSCCREMDRYRKREQNDAAYCVELFRRALQGNQNEAWECLLGQCVGDFLRAKLFKHVCWPTARKYQDAHFYIVESFARLWRSNAGHPLRVDSLGSLLLLLHRCLHSAILEELRLWKPPDARGGLPIPPPDVPDPMETLINRERLREIWDCANSDRERRIFNLRWVLGYTPQAMVDNWPSDFPDTREISQTLQNILARYYRRKRKFDGE